MTIRTTYPRIPLKDMDAAMLSFELLREIDRVLVSDDDKEMISSAAMLATHLHRNQTRKARKNMPRTPYIEHPMRVTLRLVRWGVDDAAVLTAALLHDTLEDCAEELAAIDHNTDDAEERILRLAAADWMRRSYGSAVTNIIEAVTNPLKSGYHDHLRQLAEDGSIAAQLVKVSDLIDNAASLPHQRGEVPEVFIAKRVPKYLLASQTLLAALEENTCQQEYIKTAAEALGRTLFSLKELSADL